ncbi:glycosyltransferase family 2 protein [Photobacterium sp. TY1-4]|uniref:glycosyltransferase family 2 protein n=1 Tax=Photobacterium sp. TY1-4 TaxID=2899122 RepID=UPI0021C22FE2|nr:glycosyltransferase family 2 protein [Photobacterium sp. TY1-4]UXI00525.1 glycosyltransferase family 2 protein [Photobacterium sp. TY1-4]
MKIAILLSTYNGESFITEQLDSIAIQSYRDFEVFIRDDGSSDNTLSLLHDYCKKDCRFKLIESNGNLGSAGSFIQLLKVVESDVYLFSDQDDVWLPSKVERVVEHFKNVDMDISVLYHTDLRVVNQSLVTLHSSFLRQQCMDANYSNSKNNILIQNFVVGCTSAVNNSLKKQVFSVDFDIKNVAMHDWWLALIAKFFGRIDFDSNKTILYRQHGKNVLGAPSNSLMRYVISMLTGAGIGRVRNFRLKVSAQAVAFMQAYEPHLAQNHKENLILVSKIGEGGSLRDLITCYENGISMQGVKRNLALIYSFLFSGEK